MKDNEIIKLLECCSGKCEEDCQKNCPIEGVRGRLGDIFKDSLDLINRQKAEIERLGRKANIKQKNRRTLQSEARKEFAERCKEKSKKRVSDIYGKRIFIEDIDNLLAEMESERE